LADFLYSIDVAVFRWINQGWSSPVLDLFFKFITQYQNFYIILIPGTLYLIVWGKAKGRWLVGSITLGLFIADQTSAHLLKPWIHRLRPCNSLEGVLTPFGKSEAFSFPSSHASNMGVSMFLLSMAFPTWRPLFIVIALLVGLSRIYLGLHYPSDLLGGYTLGVLAGWGVWWMVEKIRIPVSRVTKVESKPFTAKKRRPRRKTKKT
jgi:undecaprenyl-diphosphatase